MQSKTPLLEVDSQHNTRSYIFKVGKLLIGGSGLLFLGIMAGSTPTFQNTATSLVGTRTSLRKPLPTLHTLPGNSPFKDLTIAAIGGRCERDVSMKGVNAVMASMSPANRARVEKAAAGMVTAAEAAAAKKAPAKKELPKWNPRATPPPPLDSEGRVLKYDALSGARLLFKGEAASILKAGAVAPLGFFDPVGFSTEITEGRLLFLREAELKHGRVCMLAFIGILVGENYHPLFGGNIDMAAGRHFTATGGDIFWVAAYLQTIFMCFVEERRTAFPVIEGQFIMGLNPNDSPEAFAAKGVGGTRIAGDIKFDPLGLKPKNEKEYLELQNKELSNGRLAMIAVLGILLQEASTGEKVFDFANSGGMR